MDFNLNGIVNFLMFINDNWVSIVVLVGVVIGIEQKVIAFVKTNQDKKVEVAKAQAKETILHMVEQAETEYSAWNKAGQIKRSEVVGKIYKEYPVLSKVIDQEKMIAWIDETIDSSLVTLREVLKENK